MSNQKKNPCDCRDSIELLEEEATLLIDRCVADPPGGYDSVVGALLAPESKANFVRIAPEGETQELGAAALNALDVALSVVRRCQGAEKRNFISKRRCPDANTVGEAVCAVAVLRTAVLGSIVTGADGADGPVRLGTPPNSARFKIGDY